MGVLVGSASRWCEEELKEQETQRESHFVNKLAGLLCSSPDRDTKLPASHAHSWTLNLFKLLVRLAPSIAGLIATLGSNYDRDLIDRIVAS